MARSCQLVNSLNSIFVFTLLLLLLLAAVLVHGKPAKLPATAAENRNACKLVFQLKSNSSGQYYISSIRIPTLDKIIQQPSLADLDKISIGNACKPSIEVLHDKDIIKEARRHTNSAKYMELIDENNEDATQPLYEEQAVIYPHELYDAYQQHFIVNPISSVRQNNTSTTITTTTTEGPPVQVLENYKRFEPDGTGEYKLMLSNGMRVFKRIYKKLVNGTEIFAQTGHYSVPRTDGQSGFFTQHYVADENGFRVYLERP